MNYDFKRAAAQAGQLASSPFTIRESFIAGGLIPFGRPLMRGTPKEKIALRYNNIGTTFFNEFLGVSVYTAESVPTTTNTGGQYIAGDSVTVLTSGRFWTTLDTGLVITAGDYCYLEQNSTTTFDDFTNVSGIERINVGRFLTGGTSDGQDGKVVFLIELETGFNFTL